VRIALIEKGIPFELVTEAPWDNDTQTPKHNPLEKLPILITGSGHSIYESRYILEWLEAKHPTPRLLPDNVDGQLATRHVDVLADGVCDAFLLTFWERARASEHQNQEWLARRKRKIDGGIRAIAEIVGGREFAVGNRFGLADIAAATVVGYLTVRDPSYAWRRHYPELARYSDRIEQRASFAATRPVPQTITDKVV
jgi:glutathione S-transferase